MTSKFDIKEYKENRERSISDEKIQIVLGQVVENKFNSSCANESSKLNKYYSEYIEKGKIANNNFYSYKDDSKKESSDLSVKSQLELDNDKNSIIDEIISSPYISYNLKEYEDQFINNFIYSVGFDSTFSSDELESLNILSEDDNEKCANYEPEPKKKKIVSQEIKERLSATITFYEYFSDFSKNFKYKHDLLTNKYIFIRINNFLIKEHRQIFHKTIWIIHTFIYNLLRNDFLCNQSLVKLQMDTSLDTYIYECFDKLIKLIDYIHKNNMERFLRYDEISIEPNILKKILSIPDSKTFINSDMPTKVKFLHSYNIQILSIGESKKKIFDKSKELLEKKIVETEESIDKFLLKIFFLHIISMKHSVNISKKLNNLHFIWEIYFKDPNTIQNLENVQYNDYLLLLYDIPKWNSKRENYFDYYNFVSIINKIKERTSESEFFTSLFLIIFPLFSTDKDIKIILSNKDEIIKFVEKNHSVFKIIKNYVLALFKLTENQSNRLELS